MSELQAGMLAMIVGAKHVTENIGKVVTIESFHKEGESYKTGVFQSDLFMVSGSGLIAVFIRNDGEILKEEGSIAFCYGKYLLPIKPEADPLDQKQQQELHA